MRFAAIAYVLSITLHLLNMCYYWCHQTLLSHVAQLFVIMYCYITCFLYYVEACHYISENSQAQLFVCEDQKQVAKILEVLTNLYLLQKLLLWQNVSVTFTIDWY